MTLLTCTATAEGGRSPGRGPNSSLAGGQLPAGPAVSTIDRKLSWIRGSSANSGWNAVTTTDPVAGLPIRLLHLQEFEAFTGTLIMLLAVATAFNLTVVPHCSVDVNYVAQINVNDLLAVISGWDPYGRHSVATTAHRR